MHAVLGVRGEPGRPANPAKGIVWTSIVEHVDDVGWDDDWVTVADLDRSLLKSHPWNLTGGGAVTLQAAISKGSHTSLRDRSKRVGFFADSHEDEAFFLKSHFVNRLNPPPSNARSAVRGDGVRDWSHEVTEMALFPYDTGSMLAPLSDLGPGVGRYLWPLRSLLGGRSTFGGGTYASDGRSWYEWHQLPKDLTAHELTIAFAFVATHNHFALDRDSKVFNRSAPVIKLPMEATESEHLALLGILNSSTACFWLKQVSHAKTGADNSSGGGNRWSPEPWFKFFEFTGTAMQTYPLPSVLPVERGRLLDALAQELATYAPHAVAECATPTLSSLAEALPASERIRLQVISAQEELDWEVYRLYGLIEDDLTYDGDDLPGLAPGQRAFEILLARAVQAGEETTAWFTHHGYAPTTELPEHWPIAYRELVQRRLDAIETNPSIRLLEKPEYKRRWAQDPWERRQERALRDWLLDRLEERRFWFDASGASIAAQRCSAC